MNAKSIDIKKMYQNFVERNNAYYEKQASFNDPEEMCFQYAQRSGIIGKLHDLISNFADHSREILDAFSKYNENMRKLVGESYNLNIFNSIITTMILLANEKEEINKWSDELYDEVKLLDEKNVSEMEVSDLEKLAS